MPPEWYYIFGIVGSGVAGLWTIFLWFNRQLQGLASMVLAKMDKLQEAIITKMEYHERHDDKRFDNVNNELWTIKLRNAALDAARNANVEKKA